MILQSFSPLKNLLKNLKTRRTFLPFPLETSEYILSAIRLSKTKIKEFFCGGFMTEKDTSLTNILNTILKVPHNLSGLDYIRSMALNFAKEMDYKFVSIARPTSDEASHFHTDVYIINNQVQSNVTYELTKSGIEVLLKKRICTYPNNVTDVFPDDSFLRGENIASYVSAPIFSHDNKIIGLFFALNDKPIVNVCGDENIVEFLSGRIGSEFERIKADEDMKKNHRELEKTIEERTVHLKNALAEIQIKEQQLELRYNENVNMLRLISHDLANPLQILGMSIEALADRSPPELHRIIDRMKRSTDTMGQILFLVRELQAFGAGKKELKIESVCLDEIIEKNRFAFQDKLKEKNITLNYIKEVPVAQVRAERVSLCNNVFNNLISNAIKFSEPNTAIDISIKQVDESIIVEVTDHGIGIPEDILPYIFAYNKETSRLGTMGEKGTGFGMPLVKLFLDLYQVKVSVKSITKDQGSPEHGTSFELVFQKAG